MNWTPVWPCQRARWRKKVKYGIYEFQNPELDTLPLESVVLMPGGSDHLVAATAVGLFKSGIGKYFVPSGYNKQTNTMIEILLEAGIPKDNIIDEPNAINTFENAKLSADELFDMGISLDTPSILVKNGFHLPRCNMNYTNAGFTDLTWYRIDQPGTNTERLEREVRSWASNYRMWKNQGNLNG